MKKCKIIIKDEVNCKIDGLELPERKALHKKFEFEKPGARYLPSVRLGRWNGKVSYFSIGGTTYVNLLDQIIPLLYDAGYDIEVEDNRQSHPRFDFEEVTSETFSDTCWPATHERAGTPIVLRDYQSSIVNTFLSNPQSIFSAATGAGKCVDGKTMIEIEIDETSEFYKFLINRNME